VLKKFRDVPVAAGRVSPFERHGRRQLAQRPFAAGHLIVQSSKTVTNAQLRAKLIELIKAQGKPFGFMIDTSPADLRSPDAGSRRRSSIALVVYKVYAEDGLMNCAGSGYCRHALAALTKIVATGDTAEV